MHSILIGVLLGWGVAIPVGPMNLEIMRRSLRFGTRFGVAFGSGVSTTDLIYLVLIATGSLGLTHYPIVLKVAGVMGSLLLGWFGVGALRMKSNTSHNAHPANTSLFTNYWQGLVITLVNPLTIIFWASISSHIVMTSNQQSLTVLFAGIGVMIGTLSWVAFFNTLLQFTRHKLSDRIIHRVNIAGGIILLVFAASGLVEAFYS